MPTIATMKVRHNGVNYPIGSPIKDLKEKEKERLIRLNAARWVDEESEGTFADPTLDKTDKDPVNDLDPVLVPEVKEDDAGKDADASKDGDDLGDDVTNLSLPTAEETEDKPAAKAKGKTK
ncbi:hypothetical protein [Paenibacillus pabuli]|uniref:hypothetical protein n=1 Tax=Paenibacillus pabuli TaxID=1472 RepID=UPI001FFE66B0|nr:hypothetical protein [Paenibacillus pabuli]UPK45886.1 hypothetical protein KET34_10720 [Paenibacillus pabuli]